MYTSVVTPAETQRKEQLMARLVIVRAEARKIEQELRSIIYKLDKGR